MPPQDRDRDQSGVVLPTRVLVASICALLIAGAAFLLTAHPDHPARAEQVVSKQAPSPSPTVTSTPKVVRHRHPVHKGSVYVEVFNNSNIKGLASRTALRAENKGWNVVGSDNWYGTVPASTVYFPQRLAAAAKSLAHDLGITRLRPAISPMRLDRLTVILTSDYTG